MSERRHQTKAEAARERNREIYRPLTEEQVEAFGEKCARLGFGELFRCVDFSVTVQGYVEHEGALHQLYDLVNQREAAPYMLEALRDMIDRFAPTDAGLSAAEIACANRARRVIAKAEGLDG